MLGVSFRSFLGVMLCMRSMAMRHHCVMGGFFHRSRLVVLGSLSMVLRRHFMMLRSALVVFCYFGCSRSHSGFSFSSHRLAWNKCVTGS